MKGMMRRAARRLATLSAIMALAACGDGSKPIYVGVAGPLGQANGKSMRFAAEMARDEINAAGGIDGRKIELVFKDDQAKPERAIQVATELRDDPRVVAVIGHVTSSATLAAAKVYNDEKLGVVEISPASSSPLVTDAGPWTFRVCPSDLAHGPELANWAIRKLGKRRVTVMYRNDDYGRGLAESFSTAFGNAGGIVLARDPFLVPEVNKTEADFAPYLQRAMRDGSEALVVAGQADGGLMVLKAARAMGFKGPILGADGLTGLKDAGPIAEGIFISSAFLPDRPTQAARSFVQSYVEHFHELPDHRGAMTYDAMQVLARALREAGTDREAIRDYVAGIGTKSDAIEGVSGTIRFDKNGDAAGKDVAISVVRNGKLVTAGS